MTENEVSKILLDAAIEVQKVLGGPGLLESVYEDSLVAELRLRGLRVKQQVDIPVMYKGQLVGDPFRLDILVEDKVIVECKATEKQNPLYVAQLLTYLRQTGIKLGVLINFGMPKIVMGWERVVNGLEDNLQK